MEIMKFFPKGVVLMWASTAVIPAGWAICDTTNGTPNFVSKYPIGTVNKAEIGESLGSDTHTHQFSATTSTPSKGGPSAEVLAFETQGDHKFIHQHDVSGATGNGSSYPPSTKIIFIMKITDPSI